MRSFIPQVPNLEKGRFFACHWNGNRPGGSKITFRYTHHAPNIFDIMRFHGRKSITRIYEELKQQYRATERQVVEEIKKTAGRKKVFGPLELTEATVRVLELLCSAKGPVVLKSAIREMANLADMQARSAVPALRQHGFVEEYKEGKITVGRFNTDAFAMVKADRQSLLEAAEGRVKMQLGFPELVAYCHRKGFRFAIVSNGLDFYIEAILRDIGADNIEVLAAQTHFGPEGLEVKYTGPEGNQLQDSFKEPYIRSFLSRGYRVVYIGNGTSDTSPAKLAHHIFATDELLDYCKETNLKCTPFVDLNDAVRGLELLP